MNSKKEFIINCLDGLDDYEINVISYQVNNFVAKKDIFYKWQECKKQLEKSEQNRLKAVEYIKSLDTGKSNSIAWEVMICTKHNLLEILGEGNE